MRRSAIVIVAIVVVGSAVVAANAAGWMDAPATTQPEAPSAGPADVAEVPAPPASLDDATIVAIFDAANTADIETGELAAQRGASEQVREFGAMLARDHVQVRKMGRDLAAQLGVTPTPPADDKSAENHAQAMTRLRALSGPEFDRAFLQHEAAFHQSVIDAVSSTLLPAITNAELKALVEKVAPAFQAHMMAARQLEASLANASSGRGS